MPNRNLSPEELIQANELLAKIRDKIVQLAANDLPLQFAFRRKIYKELSYDERGKPMLRKMLKLKKYPEQSGLCAKCDEALPQTHSVLDRIDAIHGYTKTNTQLLCQSCDRLVQEGRKYS